MRVFRLRSVVVQAVQHNGSNHDELTAFCGRDAYRERIWSALVPGQPRQPELDGRVGWVWSHAWGTWLGVRVGDWVERGANGEFQVVRPHHVPLRYERTPA